MIAGNIEEVIEDMKSGVYDFTCDGKCSGCGNCCSNFLPVSDKEVRAIKKYLRKHKVEEQKRNLPFAGEVLDLTCPFRSETEKKCLIYPVRPAICRDFQCDKPRKQIEKNKALYHGKFSVVDMRTEFFRRVYK